MGTGAPTAKTKFDYAVTSRLDLISKYYDLSGKRVLDLGCGNGVYTAEIAKVADSVLGIEANERYYQDAIRLKEEERIKNLELKCCRIEDLNCIEKFDVVVMIEVLEHIPDERLVLQKIRECLVEDGYFIMFVPNKLYPFETHGMRIFGRNIHFKGSVPLLSWAPTFIRRHVVDEKIYTKRGIKRLLNDNGFEAVAFDYFLPPLDLINNKIAGPIRGTLQFIERTPLKAFGISVFCIARKRGHSGRPTL